VSWFAEAGSRKFHPRSGPRRSSSAPVTRMKSPWIDDASEMPSNVPSGVVMPTITPKLSNDSTSGASLRMTASRNAVANPFAGNVSTLMLAPSLLAASSRDTGIVGVGVSPRCGEPIFQIRTVGECLPGESNQRQQGKRADERSSHLGHSRSPYRRRDGGLDGTCYCACTWISPMPPLTSSVICTGSVSWPVLIHRSPRFSRPFMVIDPMPPEAVAEIPTERGK